MITNAEKITAWIEAHLGEPLTTKVVCEVLDRANLRDANLRDANLRDANLWGVLRVDGLRSGQATLLPTPDGWHLRVGCWTGTVDDLRAMIATDKGWPEATGRECERRRPQLAALITMCEAHMAMHADLIPVLAEHWGTTEETHR